MRSRFIDNQSRGSVSPARALEIQAANERRFQRLKKRTGRRPKLKVDPKRMPPPDRV